MAIQKPSLSIFTGDKNLGRVFSEQNQINVKYAEINAVLSNTEGRLAINALGKTRIIILQGAHDGEGFDGADDNAKLSDFIYEMEEWVNASISTAKTYTDSFGVSYNVQVVDWSWTRSFNEPGRIIYSLLMKQVAG